MTELEGWISTQEAAEILRMTPRRVRDYINDGRLVGQKINPRLWMVKKRSVETFRQERKDKNREG